MSKKNVKIKVNLPGGGSFEVEGDEESAAEAAVEVARKWQLAQSEGGSIRRRRASKPKGKRPRDFLKKLLDDGFFNDWRTIDEVVEELARQGLKLEGQRIGPAAVVLTQWAKSSKVNLVKEELSEDEKMHARGRFRYRVQEKNLFDKKEE